MRTFMTIIAAAVLAGALGGCASYSTPVVAPAKLSASQRNFEALWLATTEVLHKYHFRLDRQDRRAGVITTKPILGKHFFEFWRRDTVTPYDLAESSLQTIYRTVMVTIRRAGPKSTAYVPVVQVHVRRSNRESLGMISASDAYDLFILPWREERGMKKLMLGSDKYWASRGQQEKQVTVRVGEHANLADRLTAEIRRAAAKRLGQAK